MTHQAIFFISFGGPDRPEDILPFLEIVTRGRGIPRERLEAVAHHYHDIGGKSPINEITRRQAQALETALQARDSKIPVYVGQRNWHPFIEDTLRQMMADGVKRAVGFATAAHRCEASLERYINAVEEARTKIGPGAPVIDYVGPWFDHPLFIEAICERVREVLRQNLSASAEAMADTRLRMDDVTLARRSLGEGGWVFVAHSVPCAMAKASTYVEELGTTARRVAEQFGKKDWTLAYSSRSGNPKEPWLEPDVCDVIRQAAAKGAKDILFITIGFLADHVEVLFDQDIEAKAVADEVGIRFHRSATVGEHPRFIEMIADVIGRRMAGGDVPEERSSESTLFHDGQRLAAVKPQAAACFCCPDDQHPPCLRWTQASR